MKAVARLLLAVCAGVSAQQGGAATPPAAINGESANKSVRTILVDDTVTEGDLKQIMAKGYKPEKQARGNEVYYCRRERPLGTRFETKICKTSQRILQDELRGKEETARVERIGGNRPAK